MERKETIVLAVDTLRAHKLRTFLTLLGVVVGVASLIAVVSVIEGLNNYFTSKVMEFGSTSFSISKFSQGFNSLDDFWRESRRKNLTLEDQQAIEEACTNCALTAAIYNKNITIKRKGEAIENCDLRGVSVNAPFIGTVMELETGRHFAPVDIDHAQAEVIIGHDVADRLFPNEDPIGKELYIGGQSFTVIAVAKKTGEFFGQSQDIFARIPITVYKKMFNTNGESVTIYAQARTTQEMKVAIDEARVILRNRLHRSYSDDDGFSIGTAESILNFWKNTAGMLFLVMIGITSISLVVGGIVIMNIMLVSVTERTREIGVRKALGARRGDILGQFLAESVMLSGVGGAIGVAIGVTLAYLVSIFTPLPMSVTLWSIVTAIVASSAVGIFFGIYPARQASKLDPVVALRAE